MNKMKAIHVLLLCCAFCLTYTKASAQVDTLRGRVPYFHYNYYDSNWCKSQVNQGALYCVVPYSMSINALGYIWLSSFDSRGSGRCKYGFELMASEVAIQMNMDSASVLKGLAWGYNFKTPVNHGQDGHVFVDSNTYNTVDYIFNIYDSNMNRLWSDTVATTNLRIDHYMEAGFKWTWNTRDSAYRQWYSSNERSFGFESPEYVGLCYLMFDTSILVPETFYIGITSSTPINILYDTSLLITSFIEAYFINSRDSLTCMPYETRRYRVGPDYSEHVWEDEECHYGVQTCLYPILALPCREITGLRCQTVGSAGVVALVEWDSDESHSVYEVSYGPQGTPAGAGTMVTVSLPRFVQSLDRNSHYDFYVRARCDLDTTLWTAWSAPLHVHLASMGIIDEADALDWSLTPNPAHGSVTVQCDEGIMEVEIISMKGESLQHHNAVGAQSCAIDLTGLNKGIYIVQITTPQGTAARKLAVE